MTESLSFVEATSSCSAAAMERECVEENGIKYFVNGIPSITGNRKINLSKANNAIPKNRRRLDLVNVLIGNCTGMCATFPSSLSNSHMPRRKCVSIASESPLDLQFLELQGLRYIGLGAMVDELTPQERVYDTLEQLRTRMERLISIGYLVEKSSNDTSRISLSTSTIPFDVWNYNNSDILSVAEVTMSKQVDTIVHLTTSKRFTALKEVLSGQLFAQKHHPAVGYNKYLSGITAHNLGVLSILTGKPDDAISHFREAIYLKEAAFGQNDAEVALSWDELGIQLFAQGDFEGALTSFREAHSVRNESIKVEQYGQQFKQTQNTSAEKTPPIQSVPAPPSQHPSVAMCLNNMACCYFQMGNARQAMLTLEEADEIQQKAVGSSVQAELDLLHVAIVICNCGYMKLVLKQYEDARCLLEEALLIQQSVLDDNHRAVRDTLTNIEFANAFHSL